MSWRTIVISNRCKLDLEMGYLVVRGEDTKRVVLDEINNIIIENSAVSITGCLISELTERKIKVVFCDNKRNPTAELVSLYGCHDCSLKIKKQQEWDDDTKAAIWTEIVTDKIRKQMEFLLELGFVDEADLLHIYIHDMRFNDITNREGHAAKVYFNALFGKEFTRSAECATNAALNYGYSLILSTFNREIVANGYLTQLGIFHDNMFNYFNLSCDLMEPYRVIVDRFVHEKAYTVFETEQKHEMINVLTSTVKINGSKQLIGNAIKIYTYSVFEALNDRNPSVIKNYTNEL
ncbi:MAG: type II CRISPR-associated endonuclease Cas1 [Clostridia bacterium]|nr:type II CRISPR-associated endonuclease Cas1 [Clostridia bacterium]